ncbi:alpha/beta fold hydrolase [Desulfobulbus oligotrophicus]|uniref:Alpha/beta hydrolase n=1 Tax=Desulfobulbus oligotrophicus TaxID=1909699 RepID=A0A7T6AQS9_9BACT|nr:alpha/beta hydrolase [Desulfobulbus oligotrophicus]QQG65810.1 alpha/beta hydrolase [Desulfobulbus oligotrophicus]
METIQVKKIDCNGCSVHCLESGPTDGLPVVLLHGMKFQAETWRELGTIQALSALQLRVTALDMPGFGKSPDCTQEPAEILVEALQQLGVQQAVLIGPSMGGRIALEFAMAHPQRITGLVLVGAVGVEENRARLGMITVPCLIVWGEDDQVSPLANSDILLSKLPDARREIVAKASHPCYLDQPAHWHDLLRTFFTTRFS